MPALHKALFVGGNSADKRRLARQTSIKILAKLAPTFIMLFLSGKTCGQIFGW